MATRHRPVGTDAAAPGGRRRRSRGRLPVLFALLLLPVPAAAETGIAGARQELAYTVYFGPLPALDVTTTVETGPGHYRVEAMVAPKPWIAWALPWQARSEASGRIGNDGTIYPEDYLATAQWGIHIRRTALTYTAGGLHVTLEPPGDNEEREPVPAALMADSLDPVSAVLALLTETANGRGCPPRLPVFDGRRRFDLLTETQADAVIPPSRYSVYAGPVTVCRLHFRSLAGGWRDGERARFWQTEQPGAERPPFDLELARLHDDAPPMPVSVTGNSILGWVTVSLSSYRFVPGPVPGP